MSRLFVANDAGDAVVEITDRADANDEPQYVATCITCRWVSDPADLLDDIEQEASIHVDHQH